MNSFWDGKRYHSLNYFLRNKFGEKVFKISLDGGFSCPNRDGKISNGGCLFVVKEVQEIMLVTENCLFQSNFMI